MKLQVIDLDAKGVGEIDVDDAVFGGDVRTDLIARVVNWQLAKRRAGTHKAKGRSEVSGTTKKMYRQKGTGRARHGAARAPQFRGGGAVFGPLVRDHGHDLPKKVRKAGLRSVIASKAKDNKLVVLDSTKAASPKTKEMVQRLEKLGWSNALVIDGNEIDRNFSLAISNIIGIDVLPQLGANVYDIMRRDTLVLTRDAVSALEARLK